MLEQKIKNYRPISLLNIFLIEQFLHVDLTNYVDTCFLKFISTNHKFYSSNHALIHLIQNSKKSLDQKKIIGVVLIDLSKALDPYPMIS